MKFLFSFCLFLYSSLNALAQFDNPSNNSTRFEINDKTTVTPEGLELPAINKPQLTTAENKFYPKPKTNLGELTTEEFDMSKDDGLLVYKTDKAPKYFTRDKEAKEEYGRDQFFGDFKTNGGFVNVVYRDHEYVDGDRIRVFVNEDIVQSDISLDSSFRGFDLSLEQGVNKIDFQALNQGDSGPNTAELHVYDDKGVLISANEWNLLTGNKASIVIIKE